jgi:hypothetical protein
MDSENQEWIISDTPNKTNSNKKLQKSVTIKEKRKSMSPGSKQLNV